MKPYEEWLTQPGGLADRLHGLRRATMKAKDLADAAGWAHSKVSKLENGRQMPTADDIRTWARICGADDATTRELLDLLGQGEAVHLDWKRRALRGGAAGIQVSYDKLVRDAKVIRNLQVAGVPGLLQTGAYARAILTQSAAFHGDELRDVDEAVAARLARQSVLYETGRTFQFIVTEAALRLQLAPPEAMRGQLDRLHSVIGTPSVAFGVIPLDTPLTIAPQNSVMLCDDTAIVETFAGEATYTGDQAATFARALDQLWAEAVVGEDARRLLNAAAAALPDS